ncbi:uncharacterized protein LOC110440436 [Mizuhopecten yessoensis]|uniref:uncharacterized protein LOC110440436 n=1 Tax=Mizuhopecten yessoensis TaxID=6573 RepID=UPI000B45BAA7|nr:uncharacterized protein LOC110440436 [Mizuhopecten yessoensis]
MTKDTSKPQTLKDRGIDISDDLGKANLLNKQFNSVFSAQSPMSLKDMRDQRILQEKKGEDDMADINITVNGVFELLKRLNRSKATGPDDRVLMELAFELGPIVITLFNQSLQQQHLPTIWRKKNVTPIFKKRKRTEPANYRPVSLSCVLCKLMEHIICSQLMKHLKDKFFTHSSTDSERRGVVTHNFLSTHRKLSTTGKKEFRPM